MAIACLPKAKEGRSGGGGGGGGGIASCKWLVLVFLLQFGANFLTQTGVLS